MKRFLAYVIDYSILAILMKLVNSIILKENIIGYTIEIMWFLELSFFYIYFFLMDLIFNGSSIGKKFLNVKVVLKKQNIYKYSALHALYKFGFTIISPLALLIYLARKCTMPYDKLFYDKIE